MIQVATKHFFGTLIFVGSLSVVFVMASSCGKKVPYTIADTTTIAAPLNQRRMLALGDSYTIGQNVLEAQRFPNQTITALAAAGVKMKYPADIIAQTGWTTQDLLNGINTANPAAADSYDLVTLLIGVNNQYQRRDTAEYRIQFMQSLRKAITFAGNKKERVFVLSIPDYGVTPFGAGNATQITREIDMFNVINKQVCIQMNIDYTDITPSTRMAASDATLVADDGLHPSGIEYLKWANMLKVKMLAFVQ